MSIKLWFLGSISSLPLNLALSSWGLDHCWFHLSGQVVMRPEASLSPLGESLCLVGWWWWTCPWQLLWRPWAFGAYRLGVCKQAQGVGDEGGMGSI